jgi:hypothetical protein
MTQYRIDPRGVLLYTGGVRVGGIVVDGWDCALLCKNGMQIWLAVRGEGAWVGEYCPNDHRYPQQWRKV